MLTKKICKEEKEKIIKRDNVCVREHTFTNRQIQVKYKIVDIRENKETQYERRQKQEQNTRR